MNMYVIQLLDDQSIFARLDNKEICIIIEMDNKDDKIN